MDSDRPKWNRWAQKSLRREPGLKSALSQEVLGKKRYHNVVAWMNAVEEDLVSVLWDSACTPDGEPLAPNERRYWKKHVPEHASATTLEATRHVAAMIRDAARRQPGRLRLRSRSKLNIEKLNRAAVHLEKAIEWCEAAGWSTDELHDEASSIEEYTKPALADIEHEGRICQPLISAGRVGLVGEELRKPGVVAGTCEHCAALAAGVPWPEHWGWLVDNEPSPHPGIRHGGLAEVHALRHLGKLLEHLWIHPQPREGRRSARSWSLRALRNRFSRYKAKLLKSASRQRLRSLE